MGRDHGHGCPTEHGAGAHYDIFDIFPPRYGIQQSTRPDHGHGCPTEHRAGGRYDGRGLPVPDRDDRTIL